MRIILKILAAPFVVILTVLVAVMQYLIGIAGWILGFFSFLLGIGGLVTLFSGETFNGIVLLVLGFLVSPYGLPMAAIWLAVRLQELNYMLRDFMAN